MARARPFPWRKWNNILHRDAGYLVVGMTIIYALSGIALNHLRDWNPSYEVTRQPVLWDGPLPAGEASREAVLAFLDRHGARDRYKSHYQPAPGQLKIFLHSGSDHARNQLRTQLTQQSMLLEGIPTDIITARGATRMDDRTSDASMERRKKEGYF